MNGYQKLNNKSNCFTEPYILWVIEVLELQCKGKFQKCSEWQESNSEAFQKSATYSLGVEQQTAEVMSLPRASAANSSSVNLEQFLCISVSILQCSQILPVIQ